MMGNDFNWRKPFCSCTMYDNMEYLGKYDEYFLFWVWTKYDNKDEGILYRVKMDDKNEQDDYLDLTKEENQRKYLGSYTSTIYDESTNIEDSVYDKSLFNIFEFIKNNINNSVMAPGTEIEEP